MKYFLAVKQNIYTHYYVPSNKEYNVYQNIFVSCFEDGDVMNVKVKRLDEEKTFSLKLGEEVEAFDLLFSLRDASDRGVIKYFKSSTLDSNILADYYELVDPNTDTTSLRSRNLNTYFDPRSHMDPDLLKEHLKKEDKLTHNAIKIGEKIEKVNLDFSSYESLKASASINRFYTIHTANTNQIGNKLGFHLGGFCDEYGKGGSELAAKISGYDSLPSDLYLCLMDDKYNFLPLKEKELDSLFNYLCPPEEMFDAPEESFENYEGEEYELNDYILFVKVDSFWSKSSDQYETHYEYCYPLFIENKPFFPYFNHFFNMEGFDRIHDLITLKINRGKGDEVIDVKLNEECKLDFDYSPNNDDEEYRKGTVTLMLRHLNLREPSLPGKIKYHATFEVDDIITEDDTFYLSPITDDIDNGPTIDVPVGDTIGVFAIDIDNGFILLYGLNHEEGEEAKVYYLPLWLDKENIYKISMLDNGKKNISLNVISYVKD